MANNQEMTKVNGEQTVNQEKPAVKAFSAIQRGWNKFSTSKGGRWAIRCGKIALVGLGLKTAYDQGKKSVKPTTVYVTPIEEGPTNEETKEEETEVGTEQPAE